MRIIIFCLLLLAAGCTRTPVAEVRIVAKSPIGLTRWRFGTSDRLSREQWRLFDQAMQELKLQIMLKREASGSADIEEAFLSKIDGKPWLETVRTGLQLRLDRLMAEKAELDERMAHNARLKTNEGDAESAQVLADTKAARAFQIGQLEEKIIEAKVDLALLEKTFHPPG